MTAHHANQKVAIITGASQGMGAAMVEAYRGIKKTITIPREELCPSGQGTGAGPNSKTVDCRACRGQGVYRVAQEALRNVARHAGVKKARVALVGTDEGLLLAVEDEGVGFDPGRVRSQPALGLSSMEERVRLVGGAITISSAPNSGTRLKISIPLGTTASSA